MSWSCVNGKCKEFKSSVHDFITVDANLVRYSQFEQTETPYLEKNNSKTVEKTSKKTEKVHHTTTFKEVTEKSMSIKWKYLSHRYQVSNDTYHWPQILSTTNALGPVFHMDYPENVTQAFKYEPQSSHFNKKQYSLHCMVKHEGDKNHYLYHLSDEINHNFALKFNVIKHAFQMSQQPVRITSDNCSMQYKCKYVSGKYKQLASEIGIPIIHYFGVSGHGKGLIDPMSGFGFKGPLRKVVITEDLHYDSPQDVVSYLQQLFKDDPYKIYFELNPQEIHFVEKVVVKITNVQKQHMLCFFPSGTIQIKENICSCANCMNGKFIDCQYQPGSQICSKEITSSGESEEYCKFDNDFDDDSAAQ